MWGYDGSGQYVFRRFLTAIARHPARIVSPIDAGATVETVTVIGGHFLHRDTSLRAPAPIDS